MVFHMATQSNQLDAPSPEVDAKGKLDPNWSHWPFVAAFACVLPIIAVSTMWFYFPETYDRPVDYSFVIGSECPFVQGRNTTVGLPYTSAYCVRVYTAERADDELQEFVDVHVATLLFTVYSIHSALSYLRMDSLRRCGELLFCIVVLVEASFLNSVYHRSGRIEEELEAVVEDPEINLLDAPWNSPYAPLVKEVLYSATAVRCFALTVFAVCVLASGRR